MRVLVSGSEGLIGKCFRARIMRNGVDAPGFDLRGAVPEDIRNREQLRAALAAVDGVVHLAAVSRVVDGENDPAHCWAVNVEALDGLIREMLDLRTPPWLVFASSREVYGRVTSLPVPETAPPAPVNVYARSKAEGERLVTEARAAGLCANIGRFATVYGSAEDHADRLIPAFARAAALGGELRIDGAETTIDATHVDDVADGLERLMIATSRQEVLPTVHFASGVGTTVADLAALAQSVSTRIVTTRSEGARSHDVGKFVGDPARCQALLGWSYRTSLKDGFTRLVRDFETAAV
ncbi:SDR family oxidoreductase [Phreatobacter aquaticus]|uniref:SDR family oxidoreductase n=1 Tax=Phreatobacter aquaticus TaxID=2570229 RepID=A0A4D7QJ72_9HYPH|nr:SDR family oxidoreductase [Phreatobacter aquaticus]QCK85347.1 SDR family oxidoreductase [Phreatobacter aquaticus]